MNYSFLIPRRSLSYAKIRKQIDTSKALYDNLNSLYLNERKGEEYEYNDERCHNIIKVSNLSMTKIRYKEKSPYTSTAKLFFIHLQKGCSKTIKTIIS